MLCVHSIKLFRYCTDNEKWNASYITVKGVKSGWHFQATAIRLLPTEGFWLRTLATFNTLGGLLASYAFGLPAKYYCL